MNMLYLYDILHKVEILMGLILIISTVGMCISIGMWIDSKVYQNKIRFTRHFLTHRWFFKLIKWSWTLSFVFWLFVPSATMLKDKQENYWETEYKEMYLKYKTIQSELDTFKTDTKNFIGEKCPKVKDEFSL